jgi:hypothetical protein
MTGDSPPRYTLSSSRNQLEISPKSPSGVWRKMIRFGVRRLESLQNQAFEIGFGCRNPVRCVKSRSDPVIISLEDGIRLHRSLPHAFQRFSRVEGPERLADLPLPHCRSQITRNLYAQEVAGAALLKAGMSGHVFHSGGVPTGCTNRKENRLKSNKLLIERGLERSGGGDGTLCLRQ